MNLKLNLGSKRVKKNLSEIKIINLIDNGIHLGAKRSNLNSSLEGYILGYRNNIGIINLRFFLLELKKVLAMLEHFSFNRCKIMISIASFGNFSLEHEVKKMSFVVRKRIFLFTNKLVPGILTNFITYRRNKILRFKDLRNHKKFHLVRKKKMFNYLSEIPYFCITLNAMRDFKVLRESNIKRIVNAGFVDLDISNNVFDMIDYKLVCNTMAHRSNKFYYYILINAIKIGIYKELLYFFKFYKMDKLEKKKNLKKNLNLKFKFLTNYYNLLILNFKFKFLHSFGFLKNRNLNKFLISRVLSEEKFLDAYKMWLEKRFSNKINYKKRNKRYYKK